MNGVERVAARLDGGRNWIQGRGSDDRGGRCLLYAMAGTNTSTLVAGIIREQFPERVPLDAGPMWTCLVFNDSEATVFSDVALVLEKAAIAENEKAAAA